MRKILFYGLVFVLLLIFSNYVHAQCVNVPVANLRKGPGTNQEKSWQVYKYMPFKKIGTKGKWYKVKDVDGDVHWIYSKLVTDKFNCAVVKIDEVNIRSGPGTNYGKTFLSPGTKYDSFKVLKRKGKWVKVLNEFGDRGWIFRKFLWIY